MSWLDREILLIDKRKQRKNGWKWFAAGIIVAVIIFAVVTLYPYTHDEGVKVIYIEGTLTTGNAYDGEYAGSEYIGGLIRSAADDPLTSGIVLRVDSPGGYPAAAQEIIEDLEYAKKKKPVVVSMGEMATSAAYYVSAYADRIFANPDTITGGIGTISTFYDNSESLEKEGVSVSVVKSGDMKDLGSTYRNMTEEEHNYMQNLVDDSFELFISDVLSQRQNISRSDVEEAQIIRGENAQKLGLVDEMGNLYDAIDYVKNYDIKTGGSN
ncbi:protease-4 [Methanomicrobium sp. W14]|jgi:protease-4|uniref:signal peptide peptidase SppA n=1 Tax=Methanomicrobium sp. W14 TaxID=2817839 RepID=UPI001AE807EC|nr:signal peptide peptidase SppA [Methanomicrobium sp. W14]MBP2132128.1 protease-4 [Methanomicrobium sp. W14]